MTRRGPLPRAKIALGLALLLALLIGGGTAKGLYTDFLIQIGLVLAAAVAFTAPNGARLPPVGVALFVMLVLAGLLQLAPLPSPLIDLARPDIVSDAGGWSALRVVSLGVGRTVESLAFAATAMLFALAVTRLKPDELRGLLPFFLVGLACNLLAATLQFSLSSRAALDSFLPFQIQAGLFANTNHFSTLLFVSIPLLIYVGIFMDRLLVCGLALAFTLLLLLAAGSRSGVLIGVAITVLSIAFLSWRSRVGGLAVATLFVLVGAFGFGAISKIDLEKVDPAFGRLEFARTTIEGIGENWLWGVGYGNFDKAYQMYESPEMIFRAYVNHAHNDYLEVIFEGGLAGVVLILFYLSAFLLRYRKAASEPLQRAAFLSILFVLLHSLVDYPLRTGALAVTFAFLNGIYFYQAPIERRLRRSQAMVVEHNGKSLLVPIALRKPS